MRPHRIQPMAVIQMSATHPSSAAAVARARGFASIAPASLARLGVWNGDDWRSAHDDGAACALPSGHERLDAELPGGGWPVGGVSEILLPAFAHPEWSLVSHALAQALSRQPRHHAVLVAPPWQMFVPFAETAGIAARQLCCVHPGRAERGLPRAAGDDGGMWVSEQALKCRDVAAVLAWLPDAPPQALRRLQLLAAQQRRMLWVFRPERARMQSSPAPLRLWLKLQEKRLLVHVIKRRGPPLDEPVELPLLSARLMAELAAQSRRKAEARADAAALLDALGSGGARAPSREKHHALDGVASASLR